MREKRAKNILESKKGKPFAKKRKKEQKKLDNYGSRVQNIKSKKNMKNKILFCFLIAYTPR